MSGEEGAVDPAPSAAEPEDEASWRDEPEPDLEDHDPVARPLDLPGLRYDPILGGGSHLWGAFAPQGPPPQTGAFEPAPEEVLLEVRSPGQDPGTNLLLLALAAASLGAPLAALAFDLEALLPPAQRTQLGRTLLLLVGIGFGLGGFTLARALRSGGRATCTAGGIGVQVGAAVAWVSWAELQAYSLAGAELRLEGPEGTLALTLAQAEREALIQLLESRGIPARP